MGSRMMNNPYEYRQFWKKRIKYENFRKTP